MKDKGIIRTYATVEDENRDIDKMYEQGYTWNALSPGTIEFTRKKEVEEDSIEFEAEKNFNEIIESCDNLTNYQKRIAFKRIIQDEVEPGEVGIAVRKKLSDYVAEIDNEGR
ncbi:hypothetical protein R6Z02_12920 [Carnobacterium maltaromaticum]|uniref:hypothetical protein n=1 Tax=Carnobacterium maltaromaticum TaxID=2751 RepID=UPI00298BC261|nr:hypothetical protein [Carnobacterium maltaromaticum]MDW5524654.1 hypothetical protein [Carnobacterium maltaromaticum]